MPHSPIEQTLRNLITLRRVGNGMTREVRAEIKNLVDEVAAHIARIDPTAPRRERYRLQRLERLLAAIEAEAGGRYAEIQSRLRSALAEFGASQATTAQHNLAALLEGAAGLQPLRGLGVNHFKRVLDVDPFDGETLGGWVERAEFRFVAETRRQIRLGFAEQEPFGELGRRIRRNVQPMARRHAEGIARTGLTFMSNSAALSFYEENADVLEGVQFVAVLDGNTTPICIRWDGTVWPVNSGEIQRPPLHWNCRSTLVPVVDWASVGLEPPPESTRASEGGQIPSSTTAEQWFRAQSVTRQNEMIGRTRADLYRAGQISFRDMIGRDNRVLTLAEIS